MTAFTPCKAAGLLRSRLSAALATAAILAGCTLSPGCAQARPSDDKASAAPAAPLPVPAEPAITTASYGDWVLRCQRVGTDEKPARLCEVSQAMQVQGQAAPIAQVAIGRVPGERDLRMTVLLPVTVGFPSSVRIGFDEKAAEAPVLDLAWRRCLPGGCVADGPVTWENLKRWRAAEGPGRLLFKDASGGEVTIPLTLRGLDPALDALAKER